MESKEILRQIERERNPSHTFIKWWRREHDFLNFEILDQFMERLAAEEDLNMLEGFLLLDTEQMWEELKHRAPEHVNREKRRTGDVILWDRPGKEAQVCPFIPESLQKIFDVETRGNVIDG